MGRERRVGWEVAILLESRERKVLKFLSPGLMVVVVVFLL
jgi:hypothetical protein